MFIKVLSILFVTFLCMVTSGRNDIGFELLYSSNKISLKDVLIQFDNPLPIWITGTLIKNGPGLFEEGPTSFMHALDGYAKLSKIVFKENGSAYFSTNILQTNSFKRAEQYGKIVPYLLFGDTIPSFSPFQKLFALLNEVDNTNINVYRFPSSNKRRSWDFVALSDYWHIYKFDIDNLGPALKINPPVPDASFLFNYLPLVSSAHPLQEYGKQSYINFLSILNPFPDEQSSMHVVRIHSSTMRENIVTIKCDHISYMHSFGLTKNYAIFFADPLYVDFKKAVETVELLRSLDWKPASQTKIHVVDLSTKQVFDFQTKPGFHLHNINSYEINGKIITDFVVYPNIKFLSSMELHRLRNSSQRNDITPNSQIIRYEINIAKHSITRNVWKNSPNKFINRLDFPVINENFRFVSYCYVYGIVIKTGNDLSEVAIVKKDLCLNQDMFWQIDNHYPTEPTFVEDPNREGEDSGVLIAIVLDGVLGKSYILVLNATTLTKISKSYLPVYVPMPIHGRFFSP